MGPAEALLLLLLLLLAGANGELFLGELCLYLRGLGRWRVIYGLERFSRLHLRWLDRWQFIFIACFPKASPGCFLRVTA